MNNQVYAITLVELLVAIVLVGFLVVGIASLDNYANFYLLTSDRRAQVQNEAAYILEHMVKNIGQGIGSLNNPGAVKHTIEEWIKARWDRNLNGQPDDDGSTDWVAYRYIPAQNEIQYHATYDPSGWSTTGGEIISPKIADFNCSVTDNYVFADVTVCWDPDESIETCGSRSNPRVNMKTRIKMPSVSVN